MGWSSVDCNQWSLKTCSQASLMESVLQMRFPVPGCVKLTVKISLHSYTNPPLYITMALTASHKVLLVVQGPDGGLCLLWTWAHTVRTPGFCKSLCLCILCFPLVWEDDSTSRVSSESVSESLDCIKHLAWCPAASNHPDSSSLQGCFHVFCPSQTV